MPSPLIRRLRLGDTIRQKRSDAGMSAEALGQRANIKRPDVTRLENGLRAPNTNKLMDLLDALGVPEDSPDYRTLMRVCRDANAKGWWNSAEFADMGERQRVWADVESGATSICIYANATIPAVLQTEAYMRSRDEALAADGYPIHPAMTAARLRRQFELLREGGPHITVVMEEIVVRRLLVPAAVMEKQLIHLLDIPDGRVELRVLPLESSFAGVPAPRTPFALHTFADPDDGTALLVEMIPDDLLLRDAGDVAPYVRLFSRLRDLALSEAESAGYIAHHAALLAA